MDRYSNVVIDNKNIKKRAYESSIPLTIEKNENDIYFYTVQGDRLDLIADEYYGDVSLWVLIATANKLGKGTLYPPPGTQLRIPYNPTDELQDSWLKTDLNR